MGSDLGVREKLSCRLGSCQELVEEQDRHTESSVLERYDGQRGIK